MIPHVGYIIANIEFSYLAIYNTKLQAITAYNTIPYDTHRVIKCRVYIVAISPRCSLLSSHISNIIIATLLCQIASNYRITILLPP